MENYLISKRYRNTLERQIFKKIYNFFNVFSDDYRLVSFDNDLTITNIFDKRTKKFVDNIKLKFYIEILEYDKHDYIIFDFISKDLNDELLILKGNLYIKDYNLYLYAENIKNILIETINNSIKNLIDE